jgi:uncharacterized protein (DUF2235 family)
MGKNPITKLSDGVTGYGCKEQIEKVYYECCKHSQGPNSEIWLYGFSRGAYVIRAVAGLLHAMGVPSFKNESEFKDAYGKVLELLRKKRRGSDRACGEVR